MVYTHGNTGGGGSYNGVKSLEIQMAANESLSEAGLDYMPNSTVVNAPHFTYADFANDINKVHVHIL